jgi:hypothetical protein
VAYANSLQEQKKVGGWMWVGGWVGGPW